MCLFGILLMQIGMFGIYIRMCEGSLYMLTFKYIAEYLSHAANDIGRAKFQPIVSYKPQVPHHSKFRLCEWTDEMKLTIVKIIIVFLLQY